MRQWIRPSWPLVIGALAFALALRAPGVVLGDPDTYFHIVVGRWTMAHGALPSADPFSYSMTGGPWHTYEWLAEIAMAGAFDVGSWWGVFLLAASCFAFSAALLTRRLLRQSEPLLAVTFAIAAINLFQHHLLARPHLLALPFVIAYCSALFAERDEGHGPPYRALPLMLLWANIHGSFGFGLALTVFLGLEAVANPPPGRKRVEEARSWAVFALAAGLVTLITPNGIEGYVAVARVMAIVPMAQTYIEEWQSRSFAHFDTFELWLLVPILLGFSTGIRLPVSRVIIFLGLLHMALVHARHADLLAFVAPLAVVGALSPQLIARMPDAGRSRIAGAMARLVSPAPWPTVAAASVVGLMLTFAAMPYPIERNDGATTPGAAVDMAQRLGLTGPVFNSFGFGGYLVFRGVPVFVDGRLELYGSEFLKRYFAALKGDAPALVRLLAQYHVTWSVLMPDDGAVAVLDSLPGWRRVYADQWAVIQTRSDRATP